jgi:divalent metal cation (Fe/Co/Zn/Cd) transporter
LGENGKGQKKMQGTQFFSRNSSEKTIDNRKNRTYSLKQHLMISSREKTSGFHKLYRKGLYLEYLTVGYNIAEAFFSILFGTIANSIALIGFGLDSIIESLSGIVLIWRLHKHGKIPREAEEKIEKKALKFVALTFFVLSLYIFFQSLKKLIKVEIPSPSLPGIIVASVSIFIMPLLAWQKYKTGKIIKSRALMADSKETLACAFLSFALLGGLGIHYLFGFWQADPIAGLIIVIFLFREGEESWKESREDTELPE